MMMLRSSDFILVTTNWYLMGLLILSIIRRAATDQLGSYIVFLLLTIDRNEWQRDKGFSERSRLQRRVL